MAESLSEELERNIPLSEMISTLRTELGIAKKDGENKDIGFEVGPIELELKVKISKTTKGEAGIKFWVLNAGMEHDKNVEDTHTFRISLKPKDNDTKGPLNLNSTSEGLPQIPK